MGRALLLVAALTAAPRLLLFPVNENLFGDAISRTEMAERWSRDPHLITAVGDGAMQFGPLHLYLIGTAMTWLDREDAGRILSLAFGLVTFLPLFVLARRLIDAESGIVAGLALAVWGLHIQFSTTAASEALSVCLTIAALAAFAAALDSFRLRDFALAALLLNVVCAIRYDPWLYIVLLPASVVLTGRRPALAAGRAVLFVLMCLPFPIAWMAGNHAMHGDALYPFRFIAAEHARVAALDAGGWREVWLRLQGIGFWPFLALVSLTPGVAALAVVGMTRAWRTRPNTRWLMVATFAPVVYYAVRTTIFYDFVPLGRFMAIPLTVMLVFVREGYIEMAARLGTRPARRLATAAAALAVATPFAIGAFTFRADGRVADVMRSISPSSTNPRAVVAAARDVRSLIHGADAIAVDSDSDYLDLSFIYFSRLADDEVQRVRWPDFETRFDRQPPEFVLVFDDGVLLERADVRRAGPNLTVRGHTYVETGTVGPPMRLYRRAVRTDGKITVSPDRRGAFYEYAARSQPAPNGRRTSDAPVSAGRLRPVRGGVSPRPAGGSRGRGPQGREQGPPEGAGRHHAAAHVQPVPGAVRRAGGFSDRRALPAGVGGRRRGRAGGGRRGPRRVVLQGRHDRSRRRHARAVLPGAADEAAVPAGLQGAVPGVRRESES
jgi:hypothetical protein